MASNASLAFMASQRRLGAPSACIAPTFGGTSYAMFKAAYGAAFRILLQPAMVFAIVGAPAAPPPRSELGRTGCA
ncbi:MAG TPA: hypothetical protein PLG92_01205 [Piscinibacter sp.]|jgi:hypothetical protein|uniref:hypothetical protein n=1 Tax=Piscinibacter sp. TaxID=1903157 RepID=UPI0011D86353|nr:MAG: hypothetical protein E6Q93_11985 [Burkholderiaceae bacterium]HMY98165.1 hypothetical protein [Burkholderiaceae bacterium]HNK16967.1 hypothetical protein [Piscinibacter sp.]